MYDLNICLPVCGRVHKYLGRFQTFKKYGLVNLQKSKVLIHLMASDIKEEDLFRGWHPNVDLKVTTDHVAPPGSYSNIDLKVTAMGHVSPPIKVYTYYTKLMQAPLDSRWYVRLDDDSITDVDGLVEHLDRCYGWQEQWYFSTNYAGDCRREEEGFLGGQIKKLQDDFGHDRESCFVSQGAMRQILENADVQNILQERAKCGAGNSDQLFPQCAKIAGVWPLCSAFSCTQPAVSGMAMFGGKLYHIHFISHDLNAHDLRYFDGHDDVEKLIEFNKKYYPRIAEQYFSFCRPEFEIGVVKLGPFNKIENYVHWNEDCWRWDSGRLQFLSPPGRVSSEFIPIDDSLSHFRGWFLFDQHEHILKRVGWGIA